jgi:hypothetical protein
LGDDRHLRAGVVGRGRGDDARARRRVLGRRYRPDGRHGHGSGHRAGRVWALHHGLDPDDGRVERLPNTACQAGGPADHVGSPLRPRRSLRVHSDTPRLRRTRRRTASCSSSASPSSATSRMSRQETATSVPLELDRRRSSNGPRRPSSRRLRGRSPRRTTGSIRPDRRGRRPDRRRSSPASMNTVYVPASSARSIIAPQDEQGTPEVTRAEPRRVNCGRGRSEGGRYHLSPAGPTVAT